MDFPAIPDRQPQDVVISPPGGIIYFMNRPHLTRWPRIAVSSVCVVVCVGLTSSMGEKLLVVRLMDRGLRTMTNSPTNDSWNATELISEITHRGMLGSYFSFQGYASLRKIKTQPELIEFLKANGFPEPPINDGPSAVVDYLDKCTNKTPLIFRVWAVTEAFFLVLGGFAAIYALVDWLSR